MIRGVVSALRQTNKLLPATDPNNVTVVGLDGTPLALQRVRDGGKPFEKKDQTNPILINKTNVDGTDHWGNFKKKPTDKFLTHSAFRRRPFAAGASLSATLIFHSRTGSL